MRTTLISTLLLALLLGGTATAQQQGDLTSAYHVRIKNGMGAAATNALKSHAEWRKAQGDPWTWRIYEVATGEDMGDLIIRSNGHTWADFDAYDEFLQKGALHFNAVMGSVMEGMSNTIERDLPELSNWPEGTVAHLVSVTQFSVRIDGRRKVQDSITAINEALRGVNWGRPYSWGTTVNGGRGPSMTVAVAFKNWAEMKPPEKEMAEVLVETLGAEKAGQVWSAFAEGTRGSRNFVVRFRPDLSVNVN